jgi:hypothetical protein
MLTAEKELPSPRHWRFSRFHTQTLKEAGKEGISSKLPQPLKADQDTV